MALVVNGEAVDDAEIREEARSLRPRYMEMMRGGDPIALEMQLREWSRENVIERVLLRQEAARHAATLEALVDTVTAKIPPPKYKDVGEFYRKNKENFWVPELIHAAHIVKNVDENTTEEKALESIRAAEEELKRGAVFGEVADRVSDCTGNGGDLGWFPPGQMVPEFDEVVFKLETGATSEIFRTMFGFHIAQVMERKAAGIPGLMDVRGHIEGMMLKEKRQKALDQFVDELKAKATIHG
ncbi:MAG: prsA1 [Bryobacterales bacterium]|nr:prsA1 [Bryobacterales bacterium]